MFSSPVVTAIAEQQSDNKSARKAEVTKRDTIRLLET